LVGLVSLLLRSQLDPHIENYRLHFVVFGSWARWLSSSAARPARPPTDAGSNSEAATGDLLTTIAIVGTVVHAVSAARYWSIFRQTRSLLPAAVVACFVLPAEAMIGVALTGERKWHASWWEWHVLIVTAYLIIGLAARRDWRDERFRRLYLPSTRERHQDVSVLFADLVGFTGFAERSSPAQAARSSTRTGTSPHR
jgi:adenylate cyclase